MPLALVAVLYAALKIFVKVITGTVTAGLVYIFLTTTVRPLMNNLEQEILQKVSEFSTVGGKGVEVLIYLDFPHCVQLLLTTSAACFSLKIMSVAVRAFGINTGS